MSIAQPDLRGLRAGEQSGSLEPEPWRESSEGDAECVIRAYLASLAPTTRNEYAAVMRRFAAWRGVSTGEAFDLLLARGPAVAHRQAWEYRAALEARGLSAASINLALSALRSIVRAAHDVGVCAFTLRVRMLRRRPYRDTSGPGLAAIKRMIDAAHAQADRACAVRDAAILSLVGCLALRRCEVTRLDRGDVESDAGGLPSRLRIRGKGGSRDPEWTAIPSLASRALSEWLLLRGTAPGPLFLSLSSRYSGRQSRLSGSGIALIVRRAAANAGLPPVRVHGLRHSALTAALDANLGLAAVQAFARHRDPRAILAYDDNRACRAEVVGTAVNELLAAS